MYELAIEGENSSFKTKDSVLSISFVKDGNLIYELKANTGAFKDAMEKFFKEEVKVVATSSHKSS